MTSTVSSVLVGMAELKVLRVEGKFSCLGLGSCVGVAALDPYNKVGGMLHVMLPEAFPGKADEKPGKFADIGVPHFIRELEKAGADRRKLRVAIAGGAQVFKFSENASARMDIGARNSVGVLAALAQLGIRPIAHDLGGNRGRTMTMVVETGVVRLRLVDQGERDLCNLSC